MAFRSPFGEGEDRPYPDAAAVEAATVDWCSHGVMNTSGFRLLADMPLRTVWWGSDWDRALTTSIKRVIELPDLPGTAAYIDPELRRLCAAVDEGRQGLWNQILLVGVDTSVAQLLKSPGFEQAYGSPQNNPDSVKDTDQVFSREYDHEAGLQLVCFDNITDGTDMSHAGRVVEGAERSLDAGGVLILGGSLQTAIGRNCLDHTVDLALGTLNLEYEEQSGAGNLLTYRAVFSK